MTRRDYDEVAAILASARNQHGDSAALDDVTRELASYFARDNARFDPPRFVAAAGRVSP